MSEPIKVMLIDDHPLFRKGVGQIISDDPAFTVVGEAASGLEGLELAPGLEPDIILLDLNMKGMNGLETLRRFKASGLKTHVVIMTVSDAEDDLLEALRSGADGYLLKDMEPEDLRANLLKAFGGVTVLQECLNEVLKRAVIEPELKTPDKVNLTDREAEILECLAEGMNNKTIARNLGISDTTVKVHIKNLLRKLNLTSRLEAAVWRHQQKSKS